jgi:hypothetical protein
METEYLDRDFCAQGVAKKRIRINITKEAKNICLPAFSMNSSHCSACLTLMIRCSGAYKFENDMACKRDKQRSELGLLRSQ